MQPNFDNCDLDFTDFVEIQELDFIIPTELAAVLSHVNLRKASGPDEIPNVALRHISRKASVAFTAIYNAAIRSCLSGGVGVSLRGKS